MIESNEKDKARGNGDRKRTEPKVDWTAVGFATAQAMAIALASGFFSAAGAHLFGKTPGVMSAATVTPIRRVI